MIPAEQIVKDEPAVDFASFDAMPIDFIDPSLADDAVEAAIAAAWGE